MYYGNAATREYMSRIVHWTDGKISREPVLDMYSLWSENHVLALGFDLYGGLYLQDIRG